MANLVSIKQAAGELSVSPYTIRAWCMQRKLAFVKLGRRTLLRREDLEDFVTRNMIKAKQG